MKDLLKLYRFESVHDTPDEKALADWLEQRLKDMKIDYHRDGDNFYKLDAIDEPILSAHLDQVKTNGKVSHLYLTPDKKIVGYNADWERTSLGGDDKNGVWIILKALEKFGNTINFIISAGEECGCVGIKYLDNKNVLDEIYALGRTYCIVLDRRGITDVLKSGSGGAYCSTLAQTICNFIGDMSVTTGTLSDTATICEYCESVNMSVAYDDPHTSRESTNWEALEKIKEYVFSIIDEMVFYPTDPSVYKTTTTSYYSGYYKSSNKSKRKDKWEDEDDEELRRWYNGY